MKRALFTLFAVLCLAAWATQQSAAQQTPYWSGGSSVGSPYLVNTELELAYLASDVSQGHNYAGQYFKLTANLNLGTAPYNQNQGWMPVGIGASANEHFKGHFDGNGKTISNLFINYPAVSYIGLFGVVDGGSVTNLGLININVSGNSLVGGVAGYLLNNAQISNCYSTGTVSGTVSGSGQCVGGIAGYLNTGSLTNCYSSCTVSGETLVGGVAGGVEGTGGNGSSLLRCYSTGAVSGVSAVGGVAGYATYSSLTDCAALNPTITASGTTVGRVLGAQAYCTLTNNMAWADVVAGNVAFSGIPSGSGNGGASVIGELIHNDGTLGNRFPNNNNPWTCVKGKLPGLGAAVGMPAHITVVFEGEGTSDSPYLVKSAQALAKLAEFINGSNMVYNTKYYRLEVNLDLSEYNASNSAFNNGKGWIPIGNNDGDFTAFRGFFDGNGKTVSNLYINDSELACAGLFGYITSGSIHHLTLNNVSVTGNQYAGSVLGAVNSSSGAFLSNCNVTGTVSVTGSAAVGGVVGLTDDASNGCNVVRCYATGAVSGASRVGGITGLIQAGSALYHCAALNISVKATGDYVARVLGQKAGYINENTAWAGMSDGSGTAFPAGDGAAHVNGESKTADEINADGTLGNRFTGASGWTTANGALPGFGGTVTVPHLQTEYNVNDVAVLNAIITAHSTALGAEWAVANPADGSVAPATPEGAVT
jgi:hypothetical protein